MLIQKAPVYTHPPALTERYVYVNVLIHMVIYNYICLSILSAVPDAPHSVVASEVTKTEATISWQAPANDGGTPVEGYHVERCSDNSSRWVRQTRSPVTETTYHTDNLMEGTEYQYRVVAVNKRGESKPSEASEPFVAKLPYGRLLKYFTPDLVGKNNEIVT